MRSSLASLVTSVLLCASNGCADRDDISEVPVGGPPPTQLLVNGFDSLAGFWRTGTPLPGASGQFIPGGGTAGDGEAVTTALFRPAPGLAIRADMLSPGSTTTGGRVWCGLRSTAVAGGSAALDAGTIVNNAVGQLQFVLNGAVDGTASIADTNWHTYLINIRSDGRVEYARDGIILHISTGVMRGGRTPRPVSVGGRSDTEAMRLDNLAVTGRPPVRYTSFAESFSGGTLSAFGTAGGGGGTGPIVDTVTAGNPVPAFNPGGDATTDGEALTTSRFSIGGGIELQADLFSSTTNAAGTRVWAGFEGGNVSSTVDGVQDLAAGVVLDAAPAINAIQYVMYVAGTETVVATEPLDTNWHSFRVVVRGDRVVEFHRDGQLIASSGPALPASLVSLPVSLGGRVAGGATRADNVVVAVPGTEHALGAAQLTPGGTPLSARRFHSAVYAPSLDAMLVFGGLRGGGTPTYLGDLGRLQFGDSGADAWRADDATGTAPSARARHIAVMDAVRNRMLVHGGTDGTSVFSAVHALDLSGDTPAWSQLAPTGTAPQLQQHAAAVDPTNDRVLVFGGADGGGSFRNNVWALTFSPTRPDGAWSQLTPSGTGPSPRTGASALFDKPNRRLLLFFGNDGSGGNPAGTEVWELSFAVSAQGAWSQLTSFTAPASPPAPLAAPGTRANAAATIWAHERIALLFGGRDPVGGTFYPTAGAFPEVWSYELLPGGAAPIRVFAGAAGTAWPSAREGTTLVWDTKRDRAVLFAGEDGLAPDLGDVWELTTR